MWAHARARMPWLRVIRACNRLRSEARGPLMLNELGKLDLYFLGRVPVIGMMQMAKWPNQPT